MMSKKFLIVFHKSAIFFCSMMILISCRRDEVSTDAPITIHLFKPDNPAISAPIDKDEENGWKPLLDVDLSQSDLVINEDDITNYDWKSQKILVDREWLELSEYELPLLNYGYAHFVLALGETPIVGGIILPFISAVGSQIPVLYFSHPRIHPENDGIELHLSGGSYLAAESSFTLNDPDIAEQVRHRLLEIDKLVE